MFITPTVTSKSSNPGLSLLSRGVGEEKQIKDHKKLEVCLEPEDYHNIQGKKFYLPPLQQQAWAREKEIVREVRAHKTYTTRKGALLLYAEDLALTAEKGGKKKRSMEAEDSSYFNSINDLRSAILSYGSNPAPTQMQAEQLQNRARSQKDQPFLGFVRDRRAAGPYRQVRPGFSAKRYLANWSRSWDDSILNYLRSEGHIWDKNLFQQNVLAPNLYRRIDDDLSLVPLPYRVTRTMLVSPGEFESLEFYRIRPDSAGSRRGEEDGYEADVGEDEKGDGSRKRKQRRTKQTSVPAKALNIPGSIAMIVRDMEQKPHAVQYQELEQEQQREVLQRLLLQSALHQHQILRKIQEEQSGGEQEEEGDEKDAGQDASGELQRPPPLGIQSLATGKKRTDTSMTQYDGSPALLIPDVKAVDMENAISHLITSNSTNILGGSKAFTDQTIVDLYRASRTSAKGSLPPPPSLSQSPLGQTSNRKVMSNKYHSFPSNFSGIEPLPPIQNSLGGGDSLWSVPPSKASSGPPVITMEPPTPQVPSARKSGMRGSRLTQGLSSSQSMASASGSIMSSSESNIWRADVNEDVLLQQQELDDAEQQRTTSDGEEWAKSPRSEEEKKSRLSKASSKHSVKSAASKGSTDSGPALSINSHLSRSMENISPGQDKNSNFPGGRPVPSRLRESMRSKKSSTRSGAGSGMEADFVVMGSKKGSDYEPSVTSQLDRVPSSVVDGGQAKSRISAVRSTVRSTNSVARSQDDVHSVITDEFPTPDLEDGQQVEDALPPGGPEDARSMKLGQGVIELPMSEPSGPGSVRDRMSELHRSQPASKKSSIQGSVKAESIISGKVPGDIDATMSFKNFSYRKSSISSQDGEVSDHEGEEWPQQEDQNQVKKDGSESEVEISVEDVDAGEDEQEVDVKSASRTSSLLEPPLSVAGSSVRSQSRAQSIESQLEQLVEAASVVVDQIMQRPRSGRDLADDARLAAQLWSSKLGELFAEDESGPDRTRSAPYRRRRNSFDAASVTSSMLEETVFDGGDRVTPMSSRRVRKMRRIHSAEAAISLLRHLLKDDKSGKAGDGSLGLGVTNLGVAEKAEPEKKEALVRVPEKEDNDAKLNEELAKIVQETGLLEKKGTKSKKGSSTKSSNKSTKNKKSPDQDETGSNGGEKEKEKFVVGMPKEDKAAILLYKPMTPEKKEEEPKPPPKEKKTIQKKVKKAPAPKPAKPKKGKKKAKSVSSKSSVDGNEDEDAQSKVETEKKEEEEVKKEEEPEKKKEEEKKEEEDDYDDYLEEQRPSPESPEFIFVHDEFSDSEEEPEPAEQPPISFEDIQPLGPTISAVPSEDYSEITDFTEDSTDQGPNSISRSQAKAFKRAAEAEKRKAAVEKKRREREEAKKKAQEEAERKERIQLEWEEEKRRKEQEARERMEREAQEREMQGLEAEERQRQLALAAERDRRQQAEFKRKMEEMAKKKREEDEKRRAEEEVRRKEAEERARLEAEKMALMEEAERLEYEKRKRAEELEAARKAEEDRIRREIEEKIAEEHARLLAIEMAKRQKELEARLQFNKDLHSEANVFSHSQDMTRAFTWSYFELLEHLGIDIPDSLKEHYQSIAESQ